MRLPLPAILAVTLWSTDAWAIEVTCDDGPASCTIESVVGTFMCSCNGEPGSGSTGSSENPWADMTEEELMAECEMMLSDACPAGDTGSTSTGGDDGTGPGDSAATGASTATATATATATESDSATTDPGDPTNSGTDSDGSSDKSGCSIDGSGSGLAGMLLLALLGRARRRHPPT